jgi:O-antigen ligase
MNLPVVGSKKPHFAVDLIGAALVALSASWSAWSASASGADSTPVVLLHGAVGVAFVIGRYLGSFNRLLVPAAVVLWAAFMFVQFPRSVLSTSPVGGPLGYANANGAFFVVAGAAGLMLVARGSVLAKVVGLGISAACIAIPFNSHSYAAGFLVIGISTLALTVGIVLNWKVAVAVCGLIFVAALIVTFSLGVTEGDGRRSARVENAIEATISERRPILWGEAIDLIRREPLTGVGAGKFREESPTARADIDAQWAHHGFFQQGAEAGIPSLVLLVSIFVWGFVRLGVGRSDALRALAAVTLAVVGVHACMDYVLHFAAIPIAVSTLVGSASTSDRPEEELDWAEWEFEDADEASVASA